MEDKIKILEKIKEEVEKEEIKEIKSIIEKVLEVVKSYRKETLEKLKEEEKDKIEDLDNVFGRMIYDILRILSEKIIEKINKKYNTNLEYDAKDWWMLHGNMYYEICNDDKKNDIFLIISYDYTRNKIDIILD